MKAKLKIIKIDQPIDTKTGGKLYNVYAEGDNKKYTCFDSSIVEKLNQEFEYEVEIKESGTYTNYILKIPKTRTFGTSNKNLDKHIALQCAVSYMKDREGASKEQVIGIADYFLAWIKN